MIADASGISGYQRSRVSSSVSFFSSTSWRTMVAVKVLVIEPIGATMLVRIGVLVAGSASPRAVTKDPWPGIQSPKMTPGAFPSAMVLSMAASIAWRVSARETSSSHGRCAAMRRPRVSRRTS